VSGLLDIRAFREADLERIIEFSLRAWEPVFESIRSVLGEEVFAALYPDWRAVQAEEIRASCMSGERAVFVATVDDAPAGFATVWLNAFYEGLGVIDIIGVDPDHQRQGIAARLTQVAIEHMQDHGMIIASVETGGDPGHAPARALYEQTGFVLLPIARYFRKIGSRSR
jgi:GNAT superfamily N-acetyltransferase